MPHADTTLVPHEIQTKEAFYEHVSLQLRSLLDGQRNWVCSAACEFEYYSFLTMEPD